MAEIKIKFIYSGKPSELNNVLEHGINLYRYDKDSKRYELLEAGKLFYDDSIYNKYVVTGKCNTFELEVGDIIEHDDRICGQSIARYERG